MNEVPTSFADALGEFVAGVTVESTSPSARRTAARAVVDTLGCAIASSVHPIGEHVLGYVRNQGPGGDSRLFAGGEPCAIEHATLANATLGHALDFDDTNHPLYGHPSAVLVPTVLAVGTRTGASGADLVTAYLAGHEVEVAFARAVNHDHYAQGFHATGTLGTFGAAACAAKLLGLDAERVGQAIALAASMSAGLRANIGSMTKPLHAGLAAMHGTMAALLASTGWVSSRDAVDRPLTGYFAAYMKGGTPNVTAALDGLGQRWAIDEEYGHAVKPYPACGATHPSIEAATRIHQRLAGATDDIVSVRVGVCRLLPGILVHDEPRSGDEARFSLTYTVARALVDGRVGLEHFTPGAVGDPRVGALMRRVHKQVDERVADSSEFAAVVTVTRADGSTVEERVDLALGKNGRPMSEERLQEKFDNCLAQAGAPSAELWRAWRDIDGQPSTAPLWEALDAWWQTASPRPAGAHR